MGNNARASDYVLISEPNQRAVFFTVLGEPALKMLRYQQQFPFFKMDQLNNSIKFVNLSADLLEGDFERVLARIDEEVENFTLYVAND